MALIRTNTKQPSEDALRMIRNPYLENKNHLDGAYEGRWRTRNYVDRDGINCYFAIKNLNASHLLNADS